MKGVAKVGWSRLCRAILSFVALSGMLLLSNDSPVRGEDWPQFLGPQRDGVSREKGLIDTWPVAGLRELWRVDAGIGISGISIARGKVVTMWQDDEDQLVVALDAASGKLLWKTPLAPPFRNSMGNGPRATPTIAGDEVYAYTGEGILAAMKLADGQLLWKQDLVDELKANYAEYGMYSSPLVTKEAVIVTVGGAGAAVVAVDRPSGKLLWHTGNDAAGYSSPALFEIDAEPQVVTFTGESVLSANPATGRVLWSYPFPTEYDCNCAAPLFFNGQVFVTSGENHGCVLLKPTRDPSKPSVPYRVDEIWKSLGPTSVLRAEWQTPVLVDGYLYGFDNAGSAGPVTNLVCVEAATGKAVWQEPKFGKGNLTYADNKLFITTMIGEVVVVRAQPQGFVELGREALMGGSRQPPSIADGKLILRDNREVLCLDIRGSGSPAASTEQPGILAR